MKVIETDHAACLYTVSHCKFPTEYVGERIVKIGQYLAKIWTRI